MTPTQLCACGCGEATAPAQATGRHARRGQPRKYVSRVHCNRVVMRQQRAKNYAALYGRMTREQALAALGRTA